VLQCAQAGAPLQTAADANDLLGEAFSSQADLVAIPVERLGPDFLDLKSGVAGDVFQKFVNYRIRCAIVGDIPPALAASRALRDFIREANAGQSIWFADNFDALEARLKI
jgi:hypothetical protein